MHPCYLGKVSTIKTKLRLNGHDFSICGNSFLCWSCSPSLHFCKFFWNGFCFVCLRVRVCVCVCVLPGKSINPRAKTPLEWARLFDVRELVSLPNFFFVPWLLHLFCRNIFSLLCACGGRGRSWFFSKGFLLEALIFPGPPFFGLHFSNFADVHVADEHEKFQAAQTSRFLLNFGIFKICNFGPKSQYWIMLAWNRLHQTV